MVAAPGQVIASPRQPQGRAQFDIRIPWHLLVLRILKCSEGMKGSEAKGQAEEDSPERHTQRMPSGGLSCAAVSFPLAGRSGREAQEERDLPGAAEGKRKPYTRECKLFACG